MTQSVPKTMEAIVIDQFGGVDELKVRTLPVPEIGHDEVLLRVEAVAVSEWDPIERKGEYAKMRDPAPTFPYILGSEASGTIAAVGKNVQAFNVGDVVYASRFLNPRGGFYAQYGAVNADYISYIPGIPDALSMEQAAVMSGGGVTALRGLQDTLALQAGESILIFGAGGGIGHIAVQLAKRMGARVFAVASGEDGVALAQQVGADAAVDGYGDDVIDAIRDFAPDGLDTVLLTAGGDVAQQTLEAVRDGGRVAFPFGVEPEPQVREGVLVSGFNADPDAEILERFNRLIEMGPFWVEVAHIFPFGRVAEAHEALEEHYLGKLALRVEHD